MNKRTLVNTISLLRIPLSLLFIIFFQPEKGLFIISSSLVVVIFITDILDGFLARKYNINSVMGRHWDSLGDKSFYIAVIISFNAHGILTPIISWGLLVREVALYITRILFYDKIDKVEQIRPYTNWHGYFMYVTIFLGLLTMYLSINKEGYDLYLYIQLSAFFALTFGVSSIFKYLSLE